MGDLDALGDAVTGSLLARAVEPGAAEAAANGHTHEKNCLNCGASLIGPYCATCGQKAHIHRSMRGFMHDFVQGLFNFEGKIWRTLPMLALKPGEMTRRYIAGERAGQPGSRVDESSGRSVQVQLAADPAVGALPVAAVPVPAALQQLRPRGVRHLLAVIHDDAGHHRQPAGRGRLLDTCEPAVLRPAIPHVPALEGGLRAWKVERDRANHGT